MCAISNSDFVYLHCVLKYIVPRENILIIIVRFSYGTYNTLLNSEYILVLVEWRTRGI